VVAGEAEVRPRSRDVERVCAAILATVSRRFVSLRAAIEGAKPPVPRGLLNAVCLGVLRNYKLAERALRHCGYEPPAPRFGERYWLAVIGAYEALLRRDTVSAGRVAEKTKLPINVVSCLRGLTARDIVGGIGDRRRRLAILYSVPRWVVEVLSRLEIPGGLEALLESFQRPTPLWLRYNQRLIGTVEEALRELKRRGVKAEPDPMLEDIVKVVSVAPGSIEALPRRLFYPEDRAPAAAVHMLHRALDARAVRLLDLFSAPGNKAAHLTWLREGLVFVSVEAAVKRLLTEYRLHEEQGVRSHGAYLLADVLYLPARSSSFEAAIVDPDCTSLGRLGHSPETRIFLEVVGRGLLKRVVKLQEEGLRKALDAVKRGGAVLYTTCTLTLDENEGVLRRVINEGLAEPVEVGLEVGVPGLVHGSRRFYPHVTESTGGFAAVLRRA